MAELLRIDGSLGEGGGQILRTALALAALRAQPVQIRNIRMRRSNPGLARQHLACVVAAAQICRAEVSGAELRSKRLLFSPTIRPQAGTYHFDIGTAGSTGLVFQTVLWPLLFADGDSTVTIDGGTHNPMAPPVDFLAQSFRLALRAVGAKFDIELLRYGFYPRGGGRIVCRIKGNTELKPLRIVERGTAHGPSARIISVGLPAHVAERESATLRAMLDLDATAIEVVNARGPSPGNAVQIGLHFDNITEVVSSIGEKGVPAERVARDAAIDAHGYLASSAPVGEHLADQLVIPMALAPGGELRCTTPSQHTRTNIDVVSSFLGVEFALARERASQGSYTMQTHG